MSSRANYDAVNVTVRALRAGGLVAPADAALLAFARSTARALDCAEPGSTAFASCARAHASALDRLKGLTTHDDDAIGRMLDQLTVPATVGDSTHA